MYFEAIEGCVSTFRYSSTVLMHERSLVEILVAEINNQDEPQNGKELRVYNWSKLAIVTGAVHTLMVPFAFL